MIWKVARHFLIGVCVIAVPAAGGLLIAQRVSDGPMSFVQGGRLTTGEWVETPVKDWSFVEDKRIEFELVGPGTSRITGLMIRDGVAYIPCDLGYMWTRFEDNTITHLIYIFKTWHEKASEDGRAVLRIDGKRYRTHLVRVTEPGLIEELKVDLEDRGREYIAPAELPPAPTEPPNDVWFFRVDPPREA